MKYVLYAVTALYAGLTFFAAFSQLKKAEKKTSYAAMAAGALILIAAIGLHLISIPFTAAIYNGKKGGNFHITHHIIRFAVTLLLIAGFIFI